MERLNHHVSTLLITSALAVGGVSAGLYTPLIQFQEVQLSFDVALPPGLACVFVSFRYWFLISAALFVLFVLSLNKRVRDKPAFNRSAVKASVFGYLCAVLFLVVSALAIYWPLFQET